MSDEEQQAKTEVSAGDAEKETTRKEEGKGSAGADTGEIVPKLFRWTVLGVGVVALSLSVVSVFVCDFVHTQSLERNGAWDWNFTKTYRYGLFSNGRFGDTCSQYGDHNKILLGASQNMARAFGIIAAVASCVMWCNNGWNQTINDGRLNVKRNGIAYLVAGAMQFLPLLFLFGFAPCSQVEIHNTLVDVADSCQLGPGAIMAVLAALLNVFLGSFALAF